MHKYILKPAILFFVLFSAVVYAQSQKICKGDTGLHTYTVTGSSSGYSWEVINDDGTPIASSSGSVDIKDNTATPSSPPSSNSVTINWGLMNPGLYKVRVSNLSGGSTSCLNFDSSSCTGSSGVMGVEIKTPNNPISSVKITMIGKNNTQQKVCNGDNSVDIKAELVPLLGGSSPSPSNYTYTWTQPNLGAGINAITPTTTTPGDLLNFTDIRYMVPGSEYKVTVKDNVGCEYFASAKLVLNDRPTVKIQRACGDTDDNNPKFEVLKSTTRPITNIINYEWSIANTGGLPIVVYASNNVLQFPVTCSGCTGSTTSSNIGSNIEFSDSQRFNKEYKVKVTDSNGCTNNDVLAALDITKVPRPTVKIKLNNAFGIEVGGMTKTGCITTSPVTLYADVTDGGNTQWKKNGVDMGSNSDCYQSSTCIVKSTSPGGDVYSVTVTRNNASATYIDCSSDPTLEASSADFDSSKTSAVKLIDDETRVVHVVNNLASITSYGITDCSSSAGITLTTDLPNAEKNNYTYQWYRQIDSSPKVLIGSATSSTYIDNDPVTITTGTEGRIYTVQLKGISNTSCLPFDSQPYTYSITIPPIGNVTISSLSSNSSASCVGDTFKANAPFCGSSTSCGYLWQEVTGTTGTPPALLGTNMTYLPNHAGTYTVSVKQGACTIPSTSNITVNPRPAVPVIEKLDLTTGLTTAIPPPPPVIPAILPKLQICKNDSSLILAVDLDPALTYQWMGGSTTISPVIANNKSYIIPQTINGNSGSIDYQVEAKNSSGCTSKSVAVTVQENPLPDSTIKINPAGKISFCVGDPDSPQLTAQNLPLFQSVGGFSFQWLKVGDPTFTPITNGLFTVTDTGNYKLTVTDNRFPTNCFSSNTILITKNPLPVTEDIKHD